MLPALWPFGAKIEGEIMALDNEKCFIIGVYIILAFAIIIQSYECTRGVLEMLFYLV